MPIAIVEMLIQVLLAISTVLERYQIELHIVQTQTLSALSQSLSRSVKK